MLDAGADVLLHSFVHGVELDGGTVAAVRLWTKGGERVIRPRVVVDASGDADVCHLAGAPYEAPGEGGQVQSLSTVFRMANVDTDRAEAVPKEELWALMREASASGDYALTRLEGSVHRTPQRGRDDGPDDADARRGRHRSRAAHARRDRGPPPVPRVLPLPPRARAGLRGGGARLDEPGDRRPREPADPRRARAHGRRDPRRDAASRTRSRSAARRSRITMRAPTPAGPTSPRARPTGSRIARCCRAGSTNVVVAGPLLLRDARRARLGAQHGHVHGDGPGGGNGRCARGGRRTSSPRELDPAALRARLQEDGADVGG